ncbi:T9SS type A sorting domain-containing protein [Maribacter sp. Hel_I_7]|uniref:T9SS type A sorting domain-containing protein n=1 Tax=Maribacter sp. Hel_I_7 TaxID=1249997 RepID=UPI00047D1E02|nr:T9SS type A sorting domain-containing protein [Maribacter sp. Hel_I_7]
MKLIFFVLLLIVANSVFGQNVDEVLNTSGIEQTNYSINAGGGVAVGQQGIYSYSIGQIFASQTFKKDGQVKTGVQQGIDFFKFSGNEALTLKIYPNPVIDFMRLSVDSLIFDNLNYQIFSLEGKLMAKNNVNDNVTEIELNFLSEGIYILLLSNNSDLITSVKFIKI